MADSPELPEPAPWKKNLRLLRRREVKKREEDAKSRNVEIELFEDFNNNKNNSQQRVQTPVQRYAHESFEKGSIKPTTPHFDAGRYSTPPRTRSPKKRALADDSCNSSTNKPLCLILNVGKRILQVIGIDKCLVNFFTMFSIILFSLSNKNAP